VVTTHDTPEAVLAADELFRRVVVRRVGWTAYNDILAALPPGWCGHDADSTSTVGLSLADPATEAEAVAAERTRIAEAVRGLADESGWGDPEHGFIRRAAVLGIIEQSPSEPHKPGDPHQYRTECHICGQRGYLHVSLEPQFAAPFEALARAAVLGIIEKEES
jgi:hypothetical protein